MGDFILSETSVERYFSYHFKYMCSILYLYLKHFFTKVFVLLLKIAYLSLYEYLVIQIYFQNTFPKCFIFYTQPTVFCVCPNVLEWPLRYVDSLVNPGRALICGLLLLCLAGCTGLAAIG
jgi:hypothetical protein